MLEPDKHWKGCVHGLNDWCVKLRRVDGINRFPKAEESYNIHSHATVGPEEVYGFASPTLARKGRTQGFDLANNKHTSISLWQMQQMNTLSTIKPSACSIADGENERVRTSLRSLASVYVRKPKLDLSSLKLWYSRGSLSHLFLLL